MGDLAQDAPKGGDTPQEPCAWNPCNPIPDEGSRSHGPMHGSVASTPYSASSNQLQWGTHSASALRVDLHRARMLAARTAKTAAEAQQISWISSTGEGRERGPLVGSACSYRYGAYPCTCLAASPPVLSAWRQHGATHQ